MKFVTFCKSWGHILELYAKAKGSLISQQVQLKKKKYKKTYNLWSPCMLWLGTVLNQCQRKLKIKISAEKFDINNFAFKSFIKK